MALIDGQLEATQLPFASPSYSQIYKHAFIDYPSTPLTNPCCCTSAVKNSSGGRPKSHLLPQFKSSSNTTQNPSHRCPSLSPPPAQPQAATLRQDSPRCGHHLRKRRKDHYHCQHWHLPRPAPLWSPLTPTSASATSTCSSASRTASNKQSSRSSMAMS
ncbi:hypothetical protein STAS_32683 [Striga asiatica]|uniref:Uncharacterized protein n=1 Tax=Striga asiatica TaxID=4170 RepID=A0A5A7RBF6_STRAF|nr:hypothetical protein STAS_32683 [Striga asiatica]